MKLVSIICLIGLMFVSVPAFAEDICFSEDTAKQITVELEKTKNLKEQVELYKTANSELVEQTKLLKDMLKLKDEQIAASDRTIKQYQEIIKFQKETYEQAIKDVKPNPIKKLIDDLGFIGIGIMIGILIL